MNTKNKSNLLLIELILAILFFSVTVSICVRVIFTAHEVSRQNSVLTKAAITGDSMVSVLKERDVNVLDGILKEHYGAVREDDIWNIYMDREFNLSDGEGARYRMTVQMNEEAYLRNILIHVTDLEAGENEEATVYSLNTSNFLQREE